MKAWQVPHSLLWQRTRESEDHLLIRMFSGCEKQKTQLEQLSAKNRTLLSRLTEKPRHNTVADYLFPWFCFIISICPILRQAFCFWWQDGCQLQPYCMYPILHAELKRECFVSSNSRSATAVKTVGVTRIEVSSLAKHYPGDEMFWLQRGHHHALSGRRAFLHSPVRALLPAGRKAVDAGKRKTTRMHCSWIALTLSLHEATSPMSLQSCWKCKALSDFWYFLRLFSFQLTTLGLYTSTVLDGACFLMKRRIIWVLFNATGVCSGLTFSLVSAPEENHGWRSRWGVKRGRHQFTVPKWYLNNVGTR